MATPSIPAQQLDDAALRDRLVELERIRNTAEARQADVIVEMHHRAAAEDIARDAALTPQTRAMVPDHAGRLIEFVADEIAVLLTCTRMAAAHRLDSAIDAALVPAVMHAWRSGTIDARKAAVICSGLRDVDPSLADALAGKAVDYATTHTVPQTRIWLTRRVMAADPAMAEIRRARASKGRRVTLTPLPDGMAELTALLPGVQARRAYDAINSLAQSGQGDTTPATGPGARDTRSSDQRRADALINLLTGHADPPQVAVHVVVSADTLSGESDAPGELTGIGPLTAHATRTLIAGSEHTIHRTLTADPDTGTLVDSSTRWAARRYRPSAALDRAVRQRDHTCRFPGCRRPALITASGTDLDHVISWPTGSTSWDNLTVLCRHHHRLKHAAGWTVTLTPDGSLTWTTRTGHTVSTQPWHYLDPPDTG